MTKVCKKCGYERKSTDGNPESQCPKCGAIYAKVQAHIDKLGTLKEQYANLSLGELEAFAKIATLDDDSKQILTDLTDRKRKEVEAIAVEEGLQRRLEEGQKQGVTSRHTVTKSRQTSSTPPLSSFFYFLAFLSFVGGWILAANFAPGDPPAGREWKIEAYTASIVWFMVGVIEAALFAAIGKVLAYLHVIAANTSKSPGS